MNIFYHQAKLGQLNFFKEKYFLVKWVYIEMIAGGETLPKNAVSKLYNHMEEGNVWLNDFLDCYLSEDDCILCGILISEGYALWIKCIHEPQLRNDCDQEIHVQLCFLCIRCKDEGDVQYLKDLLLPSPYKFITLDLFPWSRSGYYEDKILN